MPIKAAFAVPHPPLIIPQVGRGQEAQIRETAQAYEFVANEIARLAPETVVIISSHTVMYADYFHISPGKKAAGSFRAFGAPDVHFEENYDTELRERLCSLAEDMDFPAGTLGERDPQLDHGVMVPLWFLRRRYNDFRILRIGISGLPLTDHYALGYLIRAAVEAEGRSAVLIASGDLSHKLKEDGPYGFAPEGPVYDERIMEALGSGSFGELLGFSPVMCEKAAECGHRTFVMMAGAFDGLAVEAKALSHQDVTGVGYGVCAFYPKEEDGQRHFLDRYLKEKEEEKRRRLDGEDAYVRLARAALEAGLRGEKMRRIPEGVPEELTGTSAGAFVSLHKDGELRGCIGTIYPVRPTLAQEIMENAVSAGTRDPRFEPVSEEELSDLTIHVDVLSEPEVIGSPALLDPKRYGVIVSAGVKRGLLLPDLEGVNTPEEQIQIAMKKGRIDPGETIVLQRFTVKRHS